MKPEIEIQNLRARQERLKRLVQQLDVRIDRVAEAIAVTPGPQTAPAAPLPPLISKLAAPSPLMPAPTSPVAAVSGMDQPGAGASGHQETARQAKLPQLPPPVPPPPAHPVAQPSPVPPSGADANDTLEIQFGRVWLVRIGIVVLLTGLVFLGNLAYQRIVPMLGPGGKLAAIGLAGGILCAIGWKLEKSRESLRNYARVLLAGGCATLYYTAYAAHFVSALRVIESPLAGGVLLLALAGGIVGFAHRKKSEPLAVLAVLLTYYVSSVNPVGGFTLYSSLLLTASAVFLLIKNRWVRLSFVSLVGSYASYGWWRFFQGGTASSSLEMQLLFLTGYWLTFTAGAFAAVKAAFQGRSRVSFLSVNNGAFFLLASYEFWAFDGGRFWLFSAAFGLVLLALNILRDKLHPQEEEVAGPMFAQGLALFTLGLVVRLTGFELALALAAQSLVLLSGRRRASLLQQGAAWLSALAAAAVCVNDFERKEAYASLTGGAVALVLAFHGWWAKTHQKDGRDEVPLALIFAGFAVGLGFMSIHQAVDAPTAAAWCALGAALLAAAGTLLRFRELAVIGQLLLPAAVAVWAPTHSQAVLPPWCILASGVGLALWWPRQKAPQPPGVDGMLIESSALEGLAAFSAAITGTAWAMQTWDHPGLMAISAGLAGLWIGATLFLRARMLTVAGLCFMALSVFRFGADFRQASWLAALCPSVMLLALAWMTRWASCLGDDAVVVAKWARPYFIGASLLLLFPWSLQHIPDPWLVFFYAVVASGCALASLRLPQLGWFALGIAFLADTQLVCRFNTAPTALHLIAILLVPACCRIARNFGKDPQLREAAPVLAWATTGLLALWLFHANTEYEWGLGATVLWALLGPVVLAAGFLLQDKAYRHSGLVLLVLGIGNVFLNDVWRLDPTSRIISFIVLGIVLLVMGYFYNRFEEKLRRWL